MANSKSSISMRIQAGIRIFNEIILLLLLVFFTSLPLNPGNGPNAGNRLCDIHIINRNDHKVKLQVEIADTGTSRARGLMFRKELDRDSGMIFVFDKEIYLNFWMKNTYIPLSIAYIGRHRIINEIYNMKPLDTSITYPSRRPGMYALEVNQGWFKRNNIAEGSRIIFNGCFGK